ncbi:hypothetical protein BpHYR1_030677 [Brachionus plicatilis]|uniref:Uncharacterized protein n=1 Tax=Brachionus plicatilis TaxID=10195 RepID=A0A3M7R8F6_BRAPC|nr:hypothetical protein BpHYR1_030677 [Brachionus plicatilis]
MSENQKKRTNSKCDSLVENQNGSDNEYKSKDELNNESKDNIILVKIDDGPKKCIKVKESPKECRQFFDFNEEMNSNDSDASYIETFVVYGIFAENQNASHFNHYNDDMEVEIEDLRTDQWKQFYTECILDEEILQSENEAIKENLRQMNEMEKKERQRQDNVIQSLKEDVEKLILENELLNEKTARSCPIINECIGKGNIRRELSSHFVIKNCPEENEKLKEENQRQIHEHLKLEESLKLKIESREMRYDKEKEEKEIIEQELIQMSKILNEMKLMETNENLREEGQELNKEKENLVDKLSKCEAVKAHLESEVLIQNEKLNDQLKKRVGDLENDNAGLRATESKLKSRVEDSSERKKRYKEKIKSLEEKLDSFDDQLFNGLKKRILHLENINNRLEICESQLHKDIESLEKEKEEDNEEEEVGSKHQRVDKLRHCILSTKYVSEKEAHQLFDNIRLCTVDPPTVSDQGKVVDRHIHLIAVPKIFKRAARDMSLKSFEKMGITIDEPRVAINSVHYNDIKDANHYANLVNYLKNKIVLIDNENVVYRSTGSKILEDIKKMKNTVKHSKEEMQEFRDMYPDSSDWKKDCIKLKLGRNYVSQLESMENQRIAEDNIKPLSKEELKDLVPFKEFIKFIREIRIKVNSHPSNSGFCVIFAGKAGAYKTTICDILAKSFGPYHTWPGSQWFERDILKFDDAA